MYAPPNLVDFLQNKENICFTTVDIRRDTTVLGLAGIKIEEGNHIDIQDLYWNGEMLPNGQRARQGMASIASEIIDSSYLLMKNALTNKDHRF